MRNFLRKTLVYLLAIGLLCPTWLVTGMMSATHAEAAGLDTKDFGVMQFSGVNGYSVGFGLLGMTASDLKSAEVKLYEGANLLSTDVTTGLLATYPTATSLSAPFNINGYFDYGKDGNWSNTGWNGTVENIPTKATVLITDKSDKTYSAEYGAPTGDTRLLLPHNYTGAQAFAVVQPADFGTMRFSGVSGYTVGFSSTTYKASQLKKIEIKLYEGATTLLATATSDQAMIKYPTATSLSAPFDVNGTFDYVADTSWTYSRWNGTLANIPTRAVIKVTDKMDNTYTVENGTLTGTPLPYMVAEDFGVMQLSNVNGYSVGFGLIGMTAADLKSVRVELFKGDTLLSTSNGVKTKINELGSAISLSSPFNIDGTFDYALDGYWSNTGWNGSLTDVPTEAVVTLVDSLGAKYTAKNTNLTGDPSSLLPSDLTQNPAIVKAVQGTGTTILIDFKGIGISATEYQILVGGVQIAAIKNTIGNDEGNVYHSEIVVPEYRSYTVEILALHYGIRVGESKVSVGVETKVPQISSKIVVPTTAVVTVAATSEVVGPTKVQAAAPAETATTVTPDDQNGKIKGDESQNSDSTDNKINWTPWIVLFVLIILAGAATGGYFYWFSGEEEVNAVVKEPKKVEKKVAEEKKTSQNVKSKQNKKSKRW